MTIRKDTSCKCSPGKKDGHCCRKTTNRERKFTHDEIGSKLPFPGGLKDREGNPLTPGAADGMFRITIASPEDPAKVLYDLSFPIGTPPAKVKRKIRRVMQKRRM